MKSTGKASVKAISKKNGFMIERTCKDAAVLQAKGNLIRKIIDDSFSMHNTNDLLYLVTFSGMDRSSKGNTIVNGLHETLNLVKAKECKPLAIPYPEIPFSEWKECECIVYAHILGGKSAIIKRGREIGKE